MFNTINLIKDIGISERSAKRAVTVMRTLQYHSLRVIEIQVSILSDCIGLAFPKILIKVLLGKFVGNKLSSILSLVIIIFLLKTYEENFANYLTHLNIIVLSSKTRLVPLKMFVKMVLNTEKYVFSV